MNPNNISIDRRIANSSAANAHAAACRALGLIGQTGQRVRGTCVGLTESTGVLIRWETSAEDIEEQVPVVRWDGGSEQRVAAENLALERYKSRLNTTGDWVVISAWRVIDTNHVFAEYYVHTPADALDAHNSSRAGQGLDAVTAEQVRIIPDPGAYCMTFLPV